MEPLFTAQFDQLLSSKLMFKNLKEREREGRKIGTNLK